MLRLLLDEGISPSISPRLWTERIDNYALRDRGLLGLEDHEIWSLAAAQERVVATINGVDFRRLAKRDRAHAGVLIIPSGGTRDDHLQYILRGVEHARSIDVPLSNRITIVSSDGDVQFEITLGGGI